METKEKKIMSDEQFEKIVPYLEEIHNDTEEFYNALLVCVENEECINDRVFRSIIALIIMGNKDLERMMEASGRVINKFLSDIASLQKQLDLLSETLLKEGK